MVPARSFSTADVPPQYLKPCFLVGSIPFTSLRDHPSISYTLYIPPDHYNPDPSKIGKGLAPNYDRPLLPLVVNVHGTGRKAQQCRDTLISFADTNGVAILAPLFPATSESFGSLDNYKYLRHAEMQSDTAMLDMLDEIHRRWPGIDTEKVFMMGFSGGGQFTQRFLYLYPERLHAVSIGGPGVVTKLDFESDWPAGVRDVGKVFGKDVDVERIREVEIQLVIGELDCTPHGGEKFWSWLEGVEGKWRERVEDRLSKIKELRDEWLEHGIDADLIIVPGRGHDGGKMGVVEVFLEARIEEYFAKRDRE